MDSVQRMRDLIVVAGRLITVISEETGLLRKFEAGRIGELQDEKTRLSRLYTAFVRDMGREPEMLAAVDKAVRDELADVLRRFDEAAKANEEALGVARAANERVMRAIIEAASAQQHKLSGYSRAGTPSAPSRAATARPLSISVNQRY